MLPSTKKPAGSSAAEAPFAKLTTGEIARAVILIADIAAEKPKDLLDDSVVKTFIRLLAYHLTTSDSNKLLADSIKVIGKVGTHEVNLAHFVDRLSAIGNMNIHAHITSDNSKYDALANKGGPNSIMAPAVTLALKLRHNFEKLFAAAEIQLKHALEATVMVHFAARGLEGSPEDDKEHTEHYKGKKDFVLSKSFLDTLDAALDDDILHYNAQIGDIYTQFGAKAKTCSLEFETHLSTVYIAALK